MSEYFAFLKSNRFHAAVGIVLMYNLVQYGFVDTAIGNSLMGLLLAHIGIRTTDRAFEKLSNR